MAGVVLPAQTCESRGTALRIITVEEHFQHPEAVARVLELSGPPPAAPDAGFAAFLQNFAPDKDSAERLAGERLAHMDRVGIDMQCRMAPTVPAA
jgi:hypothetical protein